MANGHSVLMMPWRALIIFAFGAFLVYANIPDAEADYWQCESSLQEMNLSQRIEHRGYGSTIANACNSFVANILGSGLVGQAHCGDPVEPAGYGIAGPGTISVTVHSGDCSNTGWRTHGSNHSLISSADDCPAGMVLNPEGICEEEPPPDCSAQQGQAMTCEYLDGDPEPGSGGCHLGCTVSNETGPGITLAGLGGKKWKRYVFTGSSCEPTGVEFCGDFAPDDGTGGPSGYDGDGPTPIGDPGDGNSIGNDGGQYGGEDYPAPPPPNECFYTDGGLIVCDDSAAAGGAGADDDDDDLSGETDNNGDGEADDGFTVSNDWPSATPGSTIVDSETGEPLGTAIDQDGDGFTDGIDTDGDGDIDVDDPTDPGGGCDNNGDGVCDGSDGDNDGDGKSGEAGDCIDDPETEENECDGTGAGGGASVSGLSCNEEPQCQPDDDDPQGTLWCAQLKLQHQVSCQYHVDEAEGNPESLLSDKPEDDGSELWQETDLETEGPGLSTSVVSAAGGCYQDLEFTVLGETYAIPLSVLCPYFDAAGMIVLIVGYMVAGFVVYRGVFA